MTAAALVRDLLLGSRIEAAAAQAGVRLDRVTSIADLPPASDLDVLLVAWDERDPGWGRTLAVWRDGASSGPRLILFGPHTDVEAHREARAHGIGPVWARSRLVAELGELFPGVAGSRASAP